MEERESAGGPSDQPPVRRTSKVRRHSYRIHGLTALGVVFLCVWWYARAFICWGGHDSSLKSAWCNSHSTLYVILPLALLVLAFLIFELSELSYADLDLEGKKFRRT